MIQTSIVHIIWRKENANTNFSDKIPWKDSLIGQYTVFLMFILGDQLEKGAPKKVLKMYPPL